MAAVIKDIAMTTAPAVPAIAAAIAAKVVRGYVGIYLCVN